MKQLKTLTGFHPTFPIAGLPPFLAALQQNPLALRNHLMGLTSASPPESSMIDDDAVSNDGESVEPEDLSIRPAVVSSSTLATPVNKATSKASSDPPGDDGLTPAANDAETGSQQNWSYEEQFKQVSPSSFVHACDLTVVGEGRNGEERRGG